MFQIDFNFLSRVCIMFIFLAQNATAQNDSFHLVYAAQERRDAKPTSSHHNTSIVNVSLDLIPNFEQQIVDGIATITLTAHQFNEVNRVVFNAKKMDINNVAIKKNNLKSKINILKIEYDSVHLVVYFSQKIVQGDTLDIQINYRANPQRITSENTKQDAISDNKGVYFIAKGKNKNLINQIWTQGEPENNSVWCPIIEDHRQKFTHQISLTVPQQYTTLSNGYLKEQTILTATHQRKDVWVMDKPHSAYLMFWGVGDWAIRKAAYKHIPLQYYVDSGYANNADKIFEQTPNMIACYEDLFGIPYPWNKLSQVVVKNYVSGAMENTTAIVHDETALQESLDLNDENLWETVIAHEISHHWFGDLVTCKNWTNLTMNESFANFSEALWLEWKYGTQAADHYRLKEIQNYFIPGAYEKPLIRKNYTKIEDVFDEVTYTKGGAILWMLRQYVGDKAFFKACQLYLNRHAYKTTEVADFRLLLEEVSGLDLEWFFDQWYTGYGNPYLSINYAINDSTKTAKIIVKQELQLGEKPFVLPLQVVAYTNNKRQEYLFWAGKGMSHKDSFVLPYSGQLDMLSVDPQRNIVMIRQEERPSSFYYYQYQHSPFYAERKEAISHFYKNASKSPLAFSYLQKACLDTTFFQLRLYAYERLCNTTKLDSLKPFVLAFLQQHYSSEKNAVVKAKILEVLIDLKNENLIQYAQSGIQSQSGKLIAASLDYLLKYDSIHYAPQIAHFLTQVKSKTVKTNALKYYLNNNTFNSSIDVLSIYQSMNLSDKLSIVEPYLKYIKNNFKDLAIDVYINEIIKLKNDVPRAYTPFKDYLTEEINNVIQILKSKKHKKTNLILEKLEKQNQL